MRKTIFMMITVLAVSVWANAQGLGEAARQARKNKRTPTATDKQFTNENLGVKPATEETPAAPASGDAPAKPAEGASGEKPADGAPAADAAAEKADSASAAEELKKKADDYKVKIIDAKATALLLERELDVLQRENKLRAASFYSDAGSRLRDERAYAEADRKYQADIAGKQKAIAEAKAKVESLREEARRAGVPAGQLD